MLRLLLGKPVLDGDVLSLDPAKLVQLLPERLPQYRAAGSSASIQETYAEDFPCLLCVCPRPAHRERDDDCKKPCPFSILDFRFPIVGLRSEESTPKYSLHLLAPLLENRQSKI